MKRQKTGYIVSWDGICMFMSQSHARDRVGGPMLGVLFNPGSGRATLFPSLDLARAAVRRSVAYWNRYPGRKRGELAYDIQRVQIP